ncbi:aspartic proteinase CDR1-like [Lotus japonicus]|uniref:aspartic proteinase CDR1-like n=1 Tax=Lotus japonicus TaxID=34305 RepID=UPI002586FF6D|nr:aspartic proteinase CDR1-like [Lotus japonicus]
MEATTNAYPVIDAYATFLLIGTPVQIVFLRVDIGSPISWFQCAPCSSCYPMQRPLFITRASSTYKELGCYSDTCLIPMMRDQVFGNCTGWKCRYNVRSGNESRSFGVMVTDTLIFEHSNAEIKNFIMGCGDSYKGPFMTQFSGVFGLGRGPLSVQSQLNAKAFSFCPVRLGSGSDQPSSIEFYDHTLPFIEDNNSVMVPLKENDAHPYYYFLQFVGISINGFMLDIQSKVWGYGLNYDGGIIIDIGTTLTYLPSDAYSVFRSEVRRVDHDLVKKPGYDGLEFCYKDDPSNVYPTIEFYFENGNIAATDSGDDDGGEVTVVEGFDVHVSLVGLDDDVVAFGELVTFGLDPGDDFAFRHGGAERRHENLTDLCTEDEVGSSPVPLARRRTVEEEGMKGVWRRLSYVDIGCTKTMYNGMFNAMLKHVESC